MQEFTESEYNKITEIPPPVTRFQRFDLYMWVESVSLAYQHLYSAPWVNPHVLEFYRIVCFLYLMTLSFFHIFVNGVADTLKYFTMWGIYLTTITYGLLFAFTIKFLSQRQTQGSDLAKNRKFYSPWLLWKWCIFFFETCLTFELIITVFFWSFIFPRMDVYDFQAYIDHITPLVILVVDYILNRMPFNFKHFPVSMILGAAYALVNLSFTLISGDPVYPPINYHNFLSYACIIVMIGSEAGFYFGLYYLTKWKLKKYDYYDVKHHNSMTIYSISDIIRSEITGNTNKILKEDRDIRLLEQETI